MIPDRNLCHPLEKVIAQILSWNGEDANDKTNFVMWSARACAKAGGLHLSSAQSSLPLVVIGCTGKKALTQTVTIRLTYSITSLQVSLAIKGSRMPRQPCSITLLLISSWWDFYVCVPWQPHSYPGRHMAVETFITLCAEKSKRNWSWLNRTSKAGTVDQGVELTQIIPLWWTHLSLY